MKELLKTIFESSRERIKTPFLGAFILAWIVFNWKGIFTILFSSLPIESRIFNVERNFSSFWSNLYWPIFAAMIYVIFLPYVLWLFDWLAEVAHEGRKQVSLSSKISDVKASQKLAIEEVRLERLKADYKDQANLNNQIDQLQEDITNYQNTVKELQEEIEARASIEIELKEALNKQNDQTLTKAEIDKFQSLYNKFKESDIYQFFEKVGTSVSRRGEVPPDVGDLIIEKFIIQKIIIESEQKESEDRSFQFTKLGHYFWRQFLASIKIVPKETPPPDIDEDYDLPF